VFQNCVSPGGWTNVAQPGLPVLPANTSAAPPFTGGNGTQATPYDCTVTTTTSGSSILIVNTVTITGLAPFQFVPIQDLNAATNGGRFSFTNNYADSTGTLVFSTVFRDLPPSASGTSFTANVKVGSGTAFINAVVNIVAALVLASPGSIAGTPNVGETLTYTTGTATGGTAPITYGWVWKDSTGATLQTDGATYVVTSAEVGKTIFVTLTATDASSQTVSGSTANFPSSGSIQTAPFPSSVWNPTPSNGLETIPGGQSGTYNGTGTSITTTGCIEASVNGGAYSQGPTAISTGQTLATRWVTSPTCGDAATGSALTGTVTDGSYTNSYSITVNRIPSPAIADLTDTSIALNATVSKGIASPIAGLNTTAYVTYVGTSTGTTISASTDNVTFTPLATTGTAFPVSNGQTLYIRQTVGGTNSTGYTAIIRVGDGSGTAGTYDEFTYTATTTANAGFPNLPSGLVTGPTEIPQTVSGTWADGTTSVTSTGCLQISLDGTTWGAGPLSVSNGVTLYERWDPTGSTCGDAADGTAITGTLTDGTYTNSYSLTLDRSPDAFTLPALTSWALSSVATSAVVTLSGTNAPTYLTYTAGSPDTLTTVEVSINGGAFTAVPTSGTTLSAPPGATLQFRGTTGAATSTTYTATINAGTTTSVLSATTLTAVASIQTPSITSPANGATALDPALNTPAGIPLVADTYTPLNGAGAVQTSSTWEVYKWVGGASPVAPTLDPPGANYAAVAGSPFTVSSAPFTTVNVPQASLTVSSTYYARVQYATTNTDAATSLFSGWSSFGTAASFTLTPGTAFGGGYYAGQINDGGTIYNLIVAPLTSGALNGQYGGASPTIIQYKTSGSADLPSATVQNEVYGGPTTDLFKASAAHPAFSTFINGASGPNAGAFNLATGGAGGGTGIGGFNDWYLPAKNELEILYRNLKPTTASNTTSWGSNPNAVPSATSNYTTTNPAQTTSALFQFGGAEAFSTANGYWSSTEDSSNALNAWIQVFLNGGQATNDKVNDRYARAIRRVAA
jgi:hypothetical protein